MWIAAACVAGFPRSLARAYLSYHGGLASTADWPLVWAPPDAGPSKVLLGKKDRHAGADDERYGGDDGEDGDDCYY